MRAREFLNRDTLFSWVATAGLPAVACGDFHEHTHLATWKTLLPCARDEASVVGYLRSARPAFIVDLATQGRPTRFTASLRTRAATLEESRCVPSRLAKTA